jgi:5-methylcytosine-specific restriction endonuclease McrA
MSIVERRSLPSLAISENPTDRISLLRPGQNPTRKIDKYRPTEAVAKEKRERTERTHDAARFIVHAAELNAGLAPYAFRLPSGDPSSLDWTCLSWLHNAGDIDLREDDEGFVAWVMPTGKMRSHYGSPPKTSALALNRRDPSGSMVVEKFENQEKAYLDWLTAHPGGYVLQTLEGISVRYMSLHRAKCRMTSRYMKNLSKGGIAERKYIKTCSDTVGDLQEWIFICGGEGFTKHCKHCDPLGDYDPARDFEKQTAKASKDTNDVRRKRLKLTPRKPTIRIVKTAQFVRNPDVVAEVLERAEGRCESCKKPAPFLRKSDGRPFLEVHHKIMLAAGGDDTVANAIAACPNCHRKLHFG